MDLKNFARNYMANLAMKTYPGRGVVVGRDEYGNPILIAWTMGRNPLDSGNRVYEKDEEVGRVWTEVANPAYPPENPELTLYDAMEQRWNLHVASNGAQTTSIVTHYDASGWDINSVQRELSEWSYEPDPNHTPRITGYVYLGSEKTEFGLSIIRKPLWGDPDDVEDAQRDFFTESDIPKGYGMGITTYVDDGKPLPSYRERPMILPIEGDSVEAIANGFWAILNPAYRVSLAVKRVPAEGGRPEIAIINKQLKIEAAN
jgi:hypothetical protein